MTHQNYLRVTVVPFKFKFELIEYITNLNKIPQVNCLIEFKMDSEKESSSAMVCLAPPPPPPPPPMLHMVATNNGRSQLLAEICNGATLKKSPVTNDSNVSIRKQRRHSLNWRRSLFEGLAFPPFHASFKDPTKQLSNQMFLDIVILTLS